MGSEGLINVVVEGQRDKSEKREFFTTLGGRLAFSGDALSLGVSVFDVVRVFGVRSTGGPADRRNPSQASWQSEASTDCIFLSRGCR